MQRIATIILLAFLAMPAWSQQFEHPDLKSGKAVVKTLVLLPPNVRIVKNGVKSTEEMVEESRAAESVLPPLITEALNKKHCEVNDKAFAGDALEKDADLKYAVADLQKRFDEVLPQIQKKPKDVRKGRFTLGDEVAKLNPGGTADALVFIRGFGQQVTGGKAFLSAMAHTYNFSGTIYHIAVVDAHTGNVLYYGSTFNRGKWPEKFFKNFPEGKGP